MVPCACEDYLIQMKLDLISCLEVVCCSHLMDHIPPNLAHSLHSVNHVLGNHTDGVTSHLNHATSHSSLPSVLI